MPSTAHLSHPNSSFHWTIFFLCSPQIFVLCVMRARAAGAAAYFNLQQEGAALALCTPGCFALYL